MNKNEGGQGAPGQKSAAKRAKKHKRRILFFILAAVLALFIAAQVLCSAYALSVSFYEIETDRPGTDIRIVHLSDLHGSSFGKENARLIEKVKEQQPDLILITGDLIDASDEDLTAALDLIAALCGIAPVYISLGNHEIEYEAAYGADIAALYEAAGDGCTYAAKVLEYEYEDIEVNGQEIRLGGIYGYCLPEEFLETGEADEEECAFLSEMQDTEAYTILLCHMPVCWDLNGALDSWDINCVLTGHTHGGQVIIPFIGGLWAPDYGFFPGSLEGLRFSETGEKVLVFSRGLGNTEWLVRFNNIPEIVVLDIKAAQ